MNDATLAARRRELAARCAEQRVGLAYELKALHPSHAAAALLPAPVARLLTPLLTRLLAHRRLAYSAAGAALALALIRPAHLRGLARLASSGWRIARQGITIAARYRP
jgi:hypothetical protein